MQVGVWPVPRVHRGVTSLPGPGRRPWGSEGRWLGQPGQEPQGYNHEGALRGLEWDHLPYRVEGRQGDPRQALSGGALLHAVGDLMPRGGILTGFHRHSGTVRPEIGGGRHCADSSRAEGPGPGRRQAGGRVGRAFPGVSTGTARVRQGEQAQDRCEYSGGPGRGLPLAAGGPARGTPRAAPGHTEARGGRGAVLRASSWPGKLFAISRNWLAPGGPVSPGSAQPQTANSRVPSPAPESTRPYLPLSPAQRPRARGPCLSGWHHLHMSREETQGPMQAGPVPQVTQLCGDGDPSTRAKVPTPWESS